MRFSRMSVLSLALLNSSSSSTNAFLPTKKHIHSPSFGIIPATAAVSSLLSTTGSSSSSSSSSNARNIKKHHYGSSIANVNNRKRIVLNANVVATAEDTEMTEPQEVFRTDYAPLPYIVKETKLTFNIHEGATRVTAEMEIVSNPKLVEEEEKEVECVTGKELVLDGEEEAVKLLSIQMNGVELVPEEDYVLSPGKLTLKTHVFDGLAKGENVTLQTEVEIVPEENTQLSGMYKSGEMYCSQCEAMGFRRITYYPDRPDNMSMFTSVRIEADKEKYPALLSNGNLIGEGDLENGRHYAVWEDPFPKPSYLFAIVAGNLAKITDQYVTKSGKRVTLQIYTEHSTPMDQLDYAMESLIKSMKWDEDVYNLEYDLDLFNIVAVGDFNMGAMENKGLNIFNTAYVLASPQTATDGDYMRVEGVIGHEYFHNWTGNRVTCRDWFQLTLKEGLTVFRDQEFSSDMNSRAVKRIEDVRGLRGRQFAEDAGPLSHPIRPDSYISMDNFYTATVYSKGAEVIRMYQTILGVEGFKKGMELYFERHDGDAVTCDDFLAAMSDANTYDLSQFSRWYNTNGTPTVSYSYKINIETKKFELTLSQTTSSGKPLHIPIKFGLLSKGSKQEIVQTQTLHLKELTQTFEFSVEDELDGVVPSLLREFSAPVKLVADSDRMSNDLIIADLAYLAANDTDGFNKWEAAQGIYTKFIFEKLFPGDDDTDLSKFSLEAFGRTLKDKSSLEKDCAIMAYALTLPSEAGLSEDFLTTFDTKLDPVAIREARGVVKELFARSYYDEVMDMYNDLTLKMNKEEELKVDAESIGRRSLRNVLLEYLCAVKATPEELSRAAKVAYSQFETSNGMTDKLAALGALVNLNCDERQHALEQFYVDADGNALVLNKWFSVQALANVDDVLDRVKALTKHPDFTLANPNRCRSLISAFTMNAAKYHAEDGEGYKFLGEILTELDKLNPQISSRMAGSLIQWRRYDCNRADMMKQELEKLRNMEKISSDLFEVVSRGLK